LQANPAGHVRAIANIGDFNFVWSKDHVDIAPRDFPDANPCAVLALPDRIYVADAGTNTLTLVRPIGSCALGDDQRDVVVLFVWSEGAHVRHNRIEKRLRCLMAMAAERLDEAIFAEFFVGVIHRFGDAVSI
jgi:hypothetical protein